MNDIEAIRRALEFADSRRLAGEGKAARATRGERREAPRYGYRVEGTATLLDAPQDRARAVKGNFPVITLSLSRTGMAFLANHELAPGDRVEVTLPTAEIEHKCYRVLVVRSRRAGLKAYEIGAVFEAGDRDGESQ